MDETIEARYAALVEAGEIERDPAQIGLVARMARLQRALVASEAARAGALGRLFRRRAAEGPPRGLYIHGDVGRGKTMLMDLFHATTPIPAKRRSHFHEFMADVHERVHDHRLRLKRGEVKDGDPLPPVAGAIAAEARLLCFDEFHVTDIADAMILGRLFSELVARGVVWVSTSNVAPDDLYEGGLNRALFLPFVEALKRHTETVRLEARADFRLEKLKGAPVYHVPAGKEGRRALDAAWRRLTGTEAGEPVTLTVKGRAVAIEAAHMGVARASFDSLCARPLGAADYLKIANAFHTLILDAVPVFAEHQRDEARRFVTLIDALYDHRVKLIVSAGAEPHALAPPAELAQAFRRTASRLIEMGSLAYLAEPHGGRAKPPETAASGVESGPRDLAPHDQSG